MRLSRLSLNLVIIAGAAVLALLVALLAAGAVERAAQRDIASRFAIEGIEGVEVATSGLQVTLSGEVADEAARFRAISAVNAVVDAARVVDHIEVTPADPVAPPDFSVEVLRNDDGISLIGLVPAATDRAGLERAIGDLAQGAHVSDLLQEADFPAPEGWDRALDFALRALERLERAKISVAPGRVEITALAGSAGEKRRLEADLARLAPAGVALDLKISAPRPVITPFTLRFRIEGGQAAFDACSAHSEEGRAAILAAARAAGMTGEAHCTIGLGVPSTRWPEAVTAAIGAVAELGGGSVTFSDADITLIAPDSTRQADFDRITGELEAALPEVFSLHAVLPERPVRIDGTGEGDDGPPEFVATLSPEGLVQLRGRLAGDMERKLARAYADARFGSDAVHVATRNDPDLPEGWMVRVLAGLEALSKLSNGAVVVQPEVVDVRGNTGNKEASAEISRLLSDKLGAAQDFRVNVTYHEALDVEAAKPTPEECVAQINAVLAGRKITFAPGSADITPEARATLDSIAEILRDCGEVPMEIGGYTDSQGREEMNKALSQNRAQAVLNALLARRVLTSNLVAVGYGEANPIADNATEEGREANRRIEFRLISGEEQAPEAEGGEEAEPGTDEGAGQVAARQHAPDEDVVHPAPRPADLVPGAGDQAPQQAADEAPQQAPEAANEQVDDQALPQQVGDQAADQATDEASDPAATDSAVQSAPQAGEDQ